MRHNAPSRGVSNLRVKCKRSNVLDSESWYISPVLALLTLLWRAIAIAWDFGFRKCRLWPGIVKKFPLFSWDIYQFTNPLYTSFLGKFENWKCITVHFGGSVSALHQVLFKWNIHLIMNNMITVSGLIRNVKLLTLEKFRMNSFWRKELTWKS